MKRLLTPLAAACLLAASPLALASGPFSALYVFGDSLSDAGQFPDASGPDGATRRFTNREGPTYQAGSGEIYGKTSPMLLGELLGLGLQTPSTSSVFEANGWEDGNNWAVGGYRTDQIYDSITAAGGSSTGLRTRDGFLVDLANRGLSLDRNALYYVNGGGNDFLQLRVLNTVQAQAAAGRVVDSVEALQSAGARYVMVSLLPDVGNTPALGGSNAFISGLVGDLNAELVGQLQGLGGNIIALNFPLMISEVLADPGQFGFDATQNLTATCFDGCSSVNATWGINSATPDPSKLFYNDSVHPTTAVQQIAADYAYSLLSAPAEISLLPEMGHGTLRAHQDQLRNQWLADWEAWQAVGQWRGFINAGGQRLDFDSQNASPSADGNGYSLNLGTSYRLDDAWRLGAAVAYYEQSLEAGRANSDYDLRSYLGTAFAQYQRNRWWGDLALSVGQLDYHSLERTLRLGVAERTEQGDTDGDLWAASGRVGYDIAEPGSRWHLSPYLSADYAKVEVDGYREDGSRATAMNFADQERESRRLGAGIQGRYQLDERTALFAEYSHQREYEDDATSVRAELNSLSGIDFELPGFVPGDTLDRGTLGVSHQLSPELAIRAGYHYGQSDDQAQHGLNLALTLDW